VLGHRPYEFGLVPDTDGFVSYKELLQALHEEPAWRYVRRSHLNEMLIGKDRSLFESSDKGLRAVERRWHFEIESEPDLVPGILYTPVKRKAHPVVMEDGLRATAKKRLVLTRDKEMALRIGARRDQSPVVLEIMARKAASQGVSFYGLGLLFLSLHIPSQFIAGPKVTKEVLERRQASLEKKEKRKPEPYDFTPGSLILDMKMEPVKDKRGRGKKRKGWKEEARKLRKR
jgi:putative RNA 2'-phosphotransferase